MDCLIPKNSGTAVYVRVLVNVHWIDEGETAAACRKFVVRDADDRTTEHACIDRQRFRRGNLFQEPAECSARGNIGNELNQVQQILPAGMRHCVKVLVERLSPICRLQIFLRRERQVVIISCVVDPVGGDEPTVIITRLNVWPLDEGLHFE